MAAGVLVILADAAGRLYFTHDTSLRGYEP